MTTAILNQVKTSEIHVGDTVLSHGMRVRIDAIREIEDATSYGGRYHSCAGTVTNLDEVREAQIVPMSWLKTEKFVEGTGWVTDRNDYWTVQGNDLATWTIERTTA